jgi:hypothetical protein
MTILKTILAATAAIVVASSAAMAAESPAATAGKTAKIHTPESIACSKEADAKNLHGDARKTFRSDCKKKMMKGEKADASKKADAPKVEAPKAPDAKAVTAPKKN